jgi:glycosyltransferase involved in cell wall biosynthesis
MKKRRIVIASVLKPVNDTRAFEKMASTLAAHGGEVFLIGQPTKNSYSGNLRIHFLPLKKFNRLSFSRLVAPLKIGLKIYQVKPELLIVNTHELLIVAVLNRIFFGTPIIYDIQENYWRNILLTNSFPHLLRPLLAGWVRLKEKLTSPLFHHFIFAEKSYEKEIGFVYSKYTVIENKVLLPPRFTRLPDPEKKVLLFSGTLAESTGVFRAIEFAKKLHAIDPKIELLIIGFCAVKNTLEEIKSAVQNHPFITLRGGNELVPHPEILDAISAANFGIVSYPLSPHIADKIPTKLYEYLGCGLPILLQNHKPWMDFCQPFGGALSFDFAAYEPAEIVTQLKSQHFNSVDSSASFQLTWQSEETKFLEAINQPIQI